MTTFVIFKLEYNKQNIFCFKSLVHDNLIFDKQGWIRGNGIRGRGIKCGIRGNITQIIVSSKSLAQYYFIFKRNWDRGEEDKGVWGDMG